MKKFILICLFCMPLTMLEEYQGAVLEACIYAKNNPAQAADYQEAVLDSLSFWN